MDLAFELDWGSWKLAFGMRHVQKPRPRSVKARDLAGLDTEIAKAKERFGLLEDAPVVGCYEAGHDGFLLHRYLAWGKERRRSSKALDGPRKTP